MSKKIEFKILPVFSREISVEEFSQRVEKLNKLFGEDKAVHLILYIDGKMIVYKDNYYHGRNLDMRGFALFDSDLLRKVNLERAIKVLQENKDIIKLEEKIAIGKEQNSLIETAIGLHHMVMALSQPD